MTVSGLSDAEVAQRVAEGKSNAVPQRAARSIADIVRANVFTRINAILGVLLAIVLLTGSVINGLFGLLIIAHSVIGMVQEIRAKQTLDKLAIVGQAKPLVCRRSGTATLLPSEVVLDDIIELGPPEGLVLITSVAFALGVVRLGQRQCLVQELPAIEGLARVDAVCAGRGCGESRIGPGQRHVRLGGHGIHGQGKGPVGAERRQGRDGD